MRMIAVLVGALVIGGCASTGKVAPSNLESDIEAVYETETSRAPAAELGAAAKACRDELMQGRLVLTVTLSSQTLEAALDGKFHSRMQVSTGTGARLRSSSGATFMARTPEGAFRLSPVYKKDTFQFFRLLVCTNRSPHVSLLWDTRDGVGSLRDRGYTFGKPSTRGAIAVSRKDGPALFQLIQEVGIDQVAVVVQP